MTVQERIKKLMDAKGWSAYRLSQEANLPQSTISHLFKRNNAPTYPTIEAICQALNMTLAQFFADEGEAISLSDEQKEILSKWNVLSNAQKDALMKFLDTL